MLNPERSLDRSLGHTTDNSGHPWTFTQKILLERYDLNQFIELDQLIEWLENLRGDIFSKMSWFMVSRAFCWLMKIIPVNRAELKSVNILFVKYEREVSVGWFLENLDWYLKRMLYSVKWFILSWCINFSIILRTVGRREIGLSFLGSVLVSFRYRDLSYATLLSSGKWDSLMDIL